MYALNNYSLSEFGALSSLGMLNTAGTIIFAVIKTPIAKLSDVIGRGHTLAIVLFFYVVPYILMSSATSLPLYFAGKVLSKIGQSGANVISTVVISDITTPRQRGQVTADDSPSNTRQLTYWAGSLSISPTSPISSRHGYRDSSSTVSSMESAGGGASGSSSSSCPWDHVS